MGILLER